MAEYEFLRAGNSEATEKKALNALFAAASGVLSGLVVTQTTTASGSVLIASGSALVHTSAVSASLLGNDTSKTLDVFTANPVGGLPRNDIVEFDQITAAIIVRIGTPNATPTDPTVPATSVVLFRLRHAASATTIPTAKIDDLRVFTSLREVDTFKSGDITAFVGTSPAYTTVKIRQEFTALGTVTTSGGVSIDFPTAFAHGITFLSGASALSAVGFLVIRQGFCTLSAYNAFAYGPGGALIATGTVIRVNIVAVGW